MISLYSGTPGSGKSLKAAEKIYNIMKYQKRLVIANFDIDTSRFKHSRSKFMYLDNSSINPPNLRRISIEWFQDHKFEEGGILLFIDECQIMFNAREWQMSNRADWNAFFTMHRKVGMDIILIAQFDRMIDRQIRSLIEYEYVHRKVSNAGLPGKLMSLLFFGSLFVQVKRWYPMKERLSAEYFAAKKKYYRLYDTYKLFET